MHAEHFTELEVMLNGLIFLVTGTYFTGTYFPPEDGDGVNPPIQEEFDINNHLLRVKGQPEAEVREILNAFDRPGQTDKRYQPSATGREQLEAAILRLIGIHNV